MYMLNQVPGARHSHVTYVVLHSSPGGAPAAFLGGRRWDARTSWGPGVPVGPGRGLAGRWPRAPVLPEAPTGYAEGGRCVRQGAPAGAPPPPLWPSDTSRNAPRAAPLRDFRDGTLCVAAQLYGRQVRLPPRSPLPPRRVGGAAHAREAAAP